MKKPFAAVVGRVSSYSSGLAKLAVAFAAGGDAVLVDESYLNCYFSEWGGRTDPLTGGGC